ncbi:uncharacterized protein LOC112594603 [Melanaphis sacchari]|uniref:uncharacterized protein LOC112594603 n=1 Tax=Melanaphis sacchari TaxID=742174 RepID=UPI000DC13BA6|nr:uncharacterized protein LOC112594603 [Melanaphis sacchari]XP_025195269.1 uncharacterized protein LOC112594603 [Melanaphis sacchari]
MSNANTNSHTTKLSGNEMPKHLSQNQSNPDSNLQVDSVASDCFRNSKLKVSFEPHRNKCGGRGMAIQQLSESMSSKSSIKNSNLDFSNSNIERYFKNLREENLKKHKEENEKIWGKCMHSNKST